MWVSDLILRVIRLPASLMDDLTRSALASWQEGMHAPPYFQLCDRSRGRCFVWMAASTLKADIERLQEQPGSLGGL